MALNVRTIGSVLGSKLITDELETSSANAAPKSANITGGTGAILTCSIDNSGNSHEIYYKLADATAATVGTTEPDFKIRVPAGGSQTFVYGDADGQTGFAFSSGFSHWVVKEADKTGTTGPDAKVTVHLLVV
jgi:hypothetical protein